MEDLKMAKGKSINIGSYNRSPRNDANPWKGDGNKPGPKTDHVREHTRTPPTSK
jgi:hypothetical protein